MYYYCPLIYCPYSRRFYVSYEEIHYATDYYQNRWNYNQMNHDRNRRNVYYYDDRRNVYRYGRNNENGRNNGNGRSGRNNSRNNSRHRNNNNSRSRSTQSHLQNNRSNTRSTIPSLHLRDQTNVEWSRLESGANVTNTSSLPSHTINLGQNINNLFNRFRNPSSQLLNHSVTPSLFLLRNETIVTLYEGNTNDDTERTGEDIDSENILCTICRQQLETNDIVRTINSCGHKYHLNCIDRWFEEHITCPTCRHDIRNTQNENIRENQDNESSSVSIERVSIPLNSSLNSSLDNILASLVSNSTTNTNSNTNSNSNTNRNPTINSSSNRNENSNSNRN